MVIQYFHFEVQVLAMNFNLVLGWINMYEYTYTHIYIFIHICVSIYPFIYLSNYLRANQPLVRLQY